MLADGRLVPGDSERLTFSGIGMYRPDFFSGIEPGSKARLAPLLNAAIEKGQVTAEHYHGRWVDVGTPERLQLLDQQLRHD